jgi:hypothetical protein
MIANGVYFRYLSPSTAMIPLSDGSLIPWSSSVAPCWRVPEGHRIGLASDALVLPPAGMGGLDRISSSTDIHTWGDLWHFQWTFNSSLSYPSMEGPCDACSILSSIGHAPNDTALYMNISTCMCYPTSTLSFSNSDSYFNRLFVRY